MSCPRLRFGLDFRIPDLMGICSIASGSFGVFGSLIVKSFGYDSFTTILFNIPFGVIRMYSFLFLTSPPLGEADT